MIEEKSIFRCQDAILPSAPRRTSARVTATGGAVHHIVGNAAREMPTTSYAACPGELGATLSTKFLAAYIFSMQQHRIYGELKYTTAVTFRLLPPLRGFLLISHFPCAMLCRLARSRNPNSHRQNSKVHTARRL